MSPVAPPPHAPPVQTGASARGRLFVVDDPLFDLHRSRGYHPERPERLHAARRAIAEFEAPSGPNATLVRLDPRDATDDELALVHAPKYLKALQSLAGREAALDADTYVSPQSVAAARRAAGGAVALVDALLRETGNAKTDATASEPKSFGVALLRPPGHHATRHRGMGFCLLNNIAVAAAAALTRGVSRVAIVDWDVHHGNGTQDIFWSDPRVLFVSLHQHPFYPGTGDADEIGADDGRGFTVNIPLSPKADDAVYARAFGEVVTPVLERFGADLILVSAGFDAHERDPLAEMFVTEKGFAQMARSLRHVASQRTNAPIALFLEGGYDLTALETSLSSTLHALWGDPADSPIPGPQPRLSQLHAHEIAKAHKIASQSWRG